MKILSIDEGLPAEFPTPTKQTVNSGNFHIVYLFRKLAESGETVGIVMKAFSRLTVWKPAYLQTDPCLRREFHI